MNSKIESYESLYESIIEQINNDTTDTTCPIVAKDENLFSSVKSEQCGDKDYENRNELYTKLLDHCIRSYKSKDKWKCWYKLFFYIIMMLCFVFIIVFSLISINHIALKVSTNLSDLGVIVGGVAGILSSILLIPKIIAEHLFPDNEDANLIGMVKNMQLNDSAIRNQFYSNQKPKP